MSDDPSTASADSPARRGAYAALLASTALGVVSSTIMSAPINEIGHSLGAGPQEIVLAVSSFTVAMVVCAPFAGWMSDRVGATTFLLGSLVLMVVAQLGAALAPNLWVMVAVRALQGVACAGIPPAVQQGLTGFWPARRRAAMGAWAAAIGLGQAIGPPTGGLITEFWGWRSVFGIHAANCAVVALAVWFFVPRMPAKDSPVHLGGLSQLVAGAGALVTGVTWFGQGGSLLGSGLLVTVGLLVLAWALRPRRGGTPLIPPGVLGDPRYIVGTAAASTGMAVMGITMVSVPLFLGRQVGLTAGVIGVTTFAVAAGMVLFGPIAVRIAGRAGSGRTLGGGLVVLIAAPLLLGWLETTDQSPAVVTPMLGVLLLVGCGIATVQSMSAIVMLGSEGGSGGLSLGVHHMVRFAGLAVGYAWISASYAFDAPLAVHAGSAFIAGSTLLLAVVARGRGREPAS